MNLNEFKVEGKQGFIQIELKEVYGFPNETSYLGGYDVKGKIDIKSGSYYVKDAELWFSTGQVYQFFSELQNCYNELKGSVTFSESENNLHIELKFNKFGQVNIHGHFQELPSQENILHFEFESEQSYLTSTLRQLNSIVGKYGKLEGKN